MRLAHDLQCLKTNSYGFASRAIDEIGRLVGGWMKRRSAPGWRRSTRLDQNASITPVITKSEF